MNLQAKFALYNAVTKIAVILVLGSIILLSLETIAIHHLDNRLIRKRQKIIENLNSREIDSLIRDQQSFTDYNILKDEYIVLTAIPDTGRLQKKMLFSSGSREIEDDTEAYRILTTQFEYKGRRYQLEIGETMLAMETIQSTIRFYTFIVLIVGLLITLVTDYAFTNYILRPFYKIIDQKINKVNDPTRYNYAHIPTNTKDFKILDKSIDSLMHKIAGLFLQEKQFIANVSHELMTPISILSGRLENMLLSDELSADHEKKIFASLKTLNRLKAVVNSLLLISRVENEQYLKSDRVNLKDELTDIYENLDDRIQAKELIFKNEVEHNFEFTGNKALIHTLLMNIVNNAIKYNVRKGEIIISDRLTKNEYILIIKDSGRGIAAQTLEHIFNRFERAPETSEEGSGLGLAIAKSIAVFHEIELSITSDEGKGSCVWMRFNITEA